MQSAINNEGILDGIVKIGHKLKEERNRRKMSIAELAEKASINITHLYRIEGNEKAIGLKSLICVTKAMNCSIDTLIPYQSYLNKNINPNLKEDVLCVNYCSEEALNSWYYDVINKIGNNIKAEREKQNISVFFIAETLKMDCMELERIENGEQLITLEQLLGISLVLNTKIDSLLEYENSKECFIVLRKRTEDQLECNKIIDNEKIDNIILKIGFVIKNEREAQSLTVAQLAERTNISITHLYRIESMHRAIGLKTLVKIAIVLNRPLEYFIMLSEISEQINECK